MDCSGTGSVEERTMRNAWPLLSSFRFCSWRSTEWAAQRLAHHEESGGGAALGTKGGGRLCAFPDASSVSR